jgi:hypothetical protein
VILDALAAAGQRIAIERAGSDAEARLRAACGLHGPADPKGLGYCGRDFRVYRWMTIAQARAYYASPGALDRALLDESLAASHLSPGIRIGRMKRAYQRALVLALLTAADPEVLVVEGGEEFDEAPARALLLAAVARARRAVVTFTETALDGQAYTCVRASAEFTSYL